MHETAVIPRPALTMPEAEAAFLSAAYDEARVILEYGAGGSTAMAAELPGTKVWAVESDVDFLGSLRAWFRDNPPKAEVRLLHGDIGPTGKWGAPASAKSWRRWHHYPLDVWDEPGFEQPDVVLIDGRFRAACFLAVAYRTAAPVSVYWDDYVDRPDYHEVERIAKPVETVGRMARFEVEPATLKGGDLAWIMDVFARQK